MSLPALSKTWQYSVNNTITATGTYSDTCRNAIYSIKNALVSFGTLPWSVISSSDGEGNSGASDLWASSANIIGNSAGSNHSWIRLRQTGIASNFELLLDCTSSTLSTGTLVISPGAGFVTGGTATDRPTATDEIVLIAGTTWIMSPDSFDQNIITNIMQSTDGQCTRIIACCQNVVTTFWMFDKPNSPVTGWTKPSVSYANATTTDVTVVANLSSASFLLRGFGSTAFNITLCSEATINSPLITALTSTNDFDSTLPLFTLGIASTTASHRGRHGSIFDLWYTLSSPATSGDTMPNDATRTFVVFGDVVFPWNGSAPVLT